MKKAFLIIAALFIGVSMYSQSKVVHLTDATFKTKVFDWEKNKDWKYSGTMPAIVDFYADWCGPCKKLSPILEEIAKEYNGKIIVYKVNTDKNQAVSAAFGIQSIPSVLFIPAKGQPQMAKGLLPKENIVQAISEVLKVKK